MAGVGERLQALIEQDSLTLALGDGLAAGDSAAWQPDPDSLQAVHHLRVLDDAGADVVHPAYPAHPLLHSIIAPEVGTHDLVARNIADPLSADPPSASVASGRLESTVLDTHALAAMQETAAHGLHVASSHAAGVASASDTPAAGVDGAPPDPELWIAATFGLDQNLITHADENGTGSGTATNSGDLFTPVSANNPSAAQHIDGLDLLQLDTQDNVFFIATQLGSTSAKVMEGSLSNALANPTATPTFTTLFSDSGGTAAITGLAVDPDNSTVYFVDTQSFKKVGYAGGAVTNLATAGVFLDGLALDLPHHVAYFASGTSTTTTTTTHVGGSHIHYHTNSASQIYETSNLTNASSSVTISKLADIPVADGSVFNGVGDPGVTVDITTGTIYFTTKTSGANQGGIWSMNPTTQAITLIYRQTGAATTVNNGIMDSIVVDHATGEYFVSIINHNGSGGGIYVGLLSSTSAPTLFETLPTYSSGTIVPAPRGFSLDNAPTLSSVTGTGTEALQGGSALSLLTAVGTDADTDNDKGDGATITITGNPQTGDQLLFGGLTSGTLDSGKVSFSYNATTHAMTLFGTDSFAEYQTLIGQVQYKDTGTDLSSGSHPTRTITFQSYDGLLSSTVNGSTTTTLVIDRAPTLGADSYALLESGSLSGTAGTAGTGVLGNDSDLDGDTITVTQLNGSAGNLNSASFAGTYGHLTLSANGSYSYLANSTSAIDSAATGSHPVDTFTYTVSDGVGGVTTSTVSFTIDRAPTVVTDAPASQALESGSAVTGNVLTNDSDKDGDTLTVSAVNGSGGNVGSSLAGTYGHVTIGSNGSYSYTADNTSAIDAAAIGSHPIDTFTYAANDGHGGTTTTTITVTVDRAPTVASDAAASQAIESGSVVTGNVLSNDSDRDGDTLSVSAAAGGSPGTSRATTYGHVTVNSDGSYSYSADNTTAINAAATGAHLIDIIAYTASDGHGGATSTNLTVTLDRGPAAVADTGAGPAIENGSAITGNTLTNDSDRDGDTLTASAVNGVGGNVGTSVATTYGHITIGSNGGYSYVADNTTAIDAAATGSHLTDSATYTASDGHGGTASTTITVTLDRGPTVASDTPASQALASGSTVTGNALSNDSDRDGDTLTVSAVNGSAGNIGNSIAGTYGHINISSNGGYGYTADSTAAIDSAATGSHLTDTLTYTASDGQGGTTATTITVTIDRAPAATGDTASAVEFGSAATGNVLTNDSDKDGDTLTVSAVNGSGGNVGGSIAGTYGHITIGSNGSYSYSADNTTAINAAATGSHLTDTFTYTASDGHGGTTSSSIAVTLDRAPTATADTGLVVFAGATRVDGGTTVLANDSDKDGDTLTVAAVNGAGGNIGTSIAGTYGHLTLNANGTYSYAADNAAAIAGQANNAVLTDTFTYAVSDGHGGTSAAVNLSFTVDQAPSVVSLNATATSTADLAVSHTVTFALATGKPVTVAGGTTLLLSNGDTATYVSGSGTQSLVFSTATTQAPGALTASSIASGGIADAAGNVLVLAGHAVGTYTDAVTDTAAHVSAQFDTLNTEVSHLSSVTLSDGGTPDLDLTVAQALNDTALIGLIASPYNLVVTDTAAHVQASLDALQADSAIDSIVFTDATAPTLTITSATQSADAGAIAKLHGPYDLLISDATGTTPEPGISGTAPQYHGVEYDYDASTALVRTVYFNDDGTRSIVGAGSGTLDDSASTTNDYLNLSIGGTVAATGGSGNDGFYFGAAFTASDQVDGGAGTNNQVGLAGNYSLTFGATSLTNIQVIACLPGFTYDLTTNDANVASGATLTVWAAQLASGNTLTFNGAAEADGRFVVFGGAGNDTITGGLGDDTFYGLGGADTLAGGGGHNSFVYTGLADSTGDAHDTITGFDAALDSFHFQGTASVTAIDTAVAGGALDSGGAFDTELTAAVNATNLGAHHAVLFTPSAGTLHDHVLLMVDANGIAGYQAGQDYVFDVTGAANLGSLSTANFA